MKKILITCMGGMSSSSLAKSIYHYADGLGIDCSLIGIYNEKDFNSVQNSKNSLTVAYMSIFGITEIGIQTSTGNEFDAILVGPQCGYILDKYKEIANRYDKPFPAELISMEDYGNINGEACFNQALKIMKIDKNILLKNDYSMLKQAFLSIF